MYMGKIILLPFSVILLIAGPLLLWQKENQPQSSEFINSKLVSAAAAAEQGVLRIEAVPEVARDYDCPVGSESEDTRCVYVKAETYVYRGGENAEWQVQGRTKQFSGFAFGQYKLTNIDKALVLGTKTYVAELAENPAEPQEDDRRVVYTYLMRDQSVVVAGEVDDRGNFFVEEHQLILSALSAGDTAEALKGGDSNVRWAWRFAALGILILGFVLLAQSLLALPLFATRLIPFLGGFVSRMVGGLSSIIAAVLAVCVWGLLLRWWTLLGEPVLQAVLIVIVTIVVLGTLWLFRRND